MALQSTQTRQVAVEVEVQGQFEECLEFSWKLVRLGSDAPPEPKVKESVVEMVIDRSDGSDTVPPQSAMIKSVEFGKDMSASLQNMPVGRKFFIAVSISTTDGKQLRSPWVRAATLHPKDRERHLGNLDPLNKPRLNCRTCSCAGYVPNRWTQFQAADKLRCRCCGCRCDNHVAVEVFDILQEREDRARKHLQRTSITALPPEAFQWDDRECDLWFLTDGAFHPHATGTSGSRSHARSGCPEGPTSPGGIRGRVSVVSPTTEARQRFHELLWKCFEAQQWPDKELVVVETFSTQHSEFLERTARSDPRLVYVKHKLPAGSDWSIGLKRNIGAHLASGEFIANFDDDDLYAPSYLATMVGELEARSALAVTLSSWFVFDVTRLTWGFCDAIAGGIAQGKDEKSLDVRAWAYGYGFSYVNRRQASLELPYEDRNMGEDFSFTSRLLLQKGENAVQLIHDYSGICIHLQHGANTSATFPIRSVSRAEVMRLDVAELMCQSYLRGLEIEHRPKSRREIVVHTSYRDCTVACPLDATTPELISLAEDELGTDFSDMCVYLVPPPGRAAQEERENMAVKVSGTEAVLQRAEAKAKAGLALSELPTDMAEAPDPTGRSGQDFLRTARLILLRRAEGPLSPECRVPALASEVWLGRPAASSKLQGLEQELSSCQYAGSDDEEESLFIVELAVQRASVKSFFADRKEVRVMLPKGSHTVGRLREELGPDLPPTAKVLAASSGGGNRQAQQRQLGESELLPAQVTVTDFLGRKGLYGKFSLPQCAKILSQLRDCFQTSRVQKQLDDIDAEVAADALEFRFRLSHLLMTDPAAYPAICQRYGLPAGGVDSLRNIPAALTLVDSCPKLLELQLEVELLMRNKSSVPLILYKIRELRKSLGLPLAICSPELAAKLRHLSIDVG
ncbi:unnamed protein product [Polarella glacialis]|uniref:Glycosyltransferase 2-like domain-containing protein n=1 Tax=Polarella glacialis TaxID=89957 RepID=A0A813KNU4_POLGL|nr:unnamed protein product [Polarella glacialis]